MNTVTLFSRYNASSRMQCKISLIFERKTITYWLHLFILISLDKVDIYLLVITCIELLFQMYYAYCHACQRLIYIPRFRVFDNLWLFLCAYAKVVAVTKPWRNYFASRHCNAQLKYNYASFLWPLLIYFSLFQPFHFIDILISLYLFLL